MGNRAEVNSDNKLEELKDKFAKETGFDISQYQRLDKGSLTSRQNGYVGGYIGGSMTKKLTDLAQQQLEEKKV